MRLFRFRSRGRSRLARSPFVFWLAVGGLAFLTASVVAGALGEARSLSVRYGPLEPVVVAARVVERGVALTPADVAVQFMPGSFAPDGAFRAADAVAGRTAVVPLLVGAPVLPGHLAPDGLSGV
ncbi:MAG: SAF domain-containing protein, partial [Acidimicrobiales bacterium]